VSIFLLDRFVCRGELLEWGGGKSFDNMERDEWYRLVTGTFFHSGVLHLVSNTFAIYFVGSILENMIGSWIFILIYLVGNVGASIVYSHYSSYTHGTGASPGIYALIACILILHVHHKEFLGLDFGSYAVNYVLYYAILGNFIGIGGLIVHVLGFGFGTIIAFVLLFLNLLT